MFEKENEGDETIPKAVGDHSRDKALSPQSHDCQYDTYGQNRHQSDPALVEMSLREDEYLQSGGENRVSTESLALSLKVTAKDKFFDETGRNVTVQIVARFVAGWSPSLCDNKIVRYLRFANSERER